MIALYILAALTAWFVVSVACGLVTGKGIHRADVLEGTADDELAEVTW